jgi:hypothetical protein
MVLAFRCPGLCHLLAQIAEVETSETSEGHGTRIGGCQGFVIVAVASHKGWILDSPAPISSHMGCDTETLFGMAHTENGL